MEKGPSISSCSKMHIESPRGRIWDSLEGILKMSGPWDLTIAVESSSPTFLESPAA